MSGSLECSFLVAKNTRASSRFEHMRRGYETACLELSGVPRRRSRKYADPVNSRIARRVSPAGSFAHRITVWGFIGVLMMRGKAAIAMRPGSGDLDGSRENVPGTSSPNEGTSCDGASLRWRRWAIGGDRRWAVRAQARGWLLSVLQSRRCVYPVGVTDGGLPSRVMSELAPITLGRDEITSDLSRYHARCSHFCFVFSFVDRGKHCAVNLTRAMEGAFNKNVRCALLRDTDSASRSV